MQTRSKIGEAIARKYPEQVVLVTTAGTVPLSGTVPSRRSKTKRNVMAVGWTCVVSGDPLMLLVGIDDEALTYRLIRETREFVVAFPSERQAAETLYAGTHHGHDLDKFAECGLAVQRASKVKAPLVADAVANFECRLVDETRPGDCPLLVGKVVAAHVNANPALRRLYTVAKGKGGFALKGVRVLRKTQPRVSPASR